jgi:adenylosuccinate lyase
MPHKMNPRSCERVNGFHAILKGHLTMIGGIIGDQWNEGDVSCSVVRRCVLPDAFLAADGLFETFITVLDQMGMYEPVVRTELNRYLPFLMTTTIMMAAVKRGVGRETAHEVIKEHAVAVSNDLRNGLISTNDLLDRLGADARLKLTREEIQEIYEGFKRFFGENPDWSLFMITTDKEAEDKVMGRPADRRRKLYNGRLETCYYQFHGEKR